METARASDLLGTSTPFLVALVSRSEIDDLQHG